MKPDIKPLKSENLILLRPAHTATNPIEHGRT
jgi:hypothetical protein